MQHPFCIKLVVFNAVDDIVAQRGGIARDAERAVVHVPAGAACDLGDLGNFQRPVLLAVEFGGRGKGHMVHIHVESHADGVGGDQKINVAGLIKRDLCVAGAG